MKKKNILLVLLLIAAAAAGIFAFLRARPDDSRGSVVLWYVDSGTMSSALEDAVQEYNAGLTRAALPVSLAAFSSEQDMADAFENGTPDILLCSHYRAFDMFSRGKLVDISGSLGARSPDYPRALSSRSSAIGSSFFPLGSSVPVLLVNNALCGGTPYGTMEALCTAAAEYTAENGAAFFAVSSYSELFCTCLLRENEEFHADSGSFGDGAGKELYNLLAECAYSGALSIADGNGAAASVYSGQLPCAFVSSAALRNTAGFGVYPVPSLSAGSGSDSVGEAWGLAVTAGSCRSTGDISAFLSWLFSGSRDTRLALQCGLVPAQGGKLITGDALRRALMDIGADSVTALPAPGGDYDVNSGEFDAALRRRMRFLSE